MLKHLFRVVHSSIREKYKKRSPKWGAVAHEKVAEIKKCEVCGSTDRLQVHHIQPFHDNPELELEPSNLVVLCMSKNECHLVCGHGGSFKTYSPIILDVIHEASEGVELSLLQQKSKELRLRI